MSNSAIRTEQDLSRVPGRSFYTQEYFRGGRIFSYAHQIDAALSIEPRTILEVGVGRGVVAAALRAMGIEVTTIDIQPELQPDLVGSVIKLPIEDETFDVAICCQVLEHLPFANFGGSLRQLRRVARQAVILSLPDAMPHYEIRLSLPRLRPLQWTGTRRREPGHDWRKRKWESDGHYWEIGYRETPLKVVRARIVESGLKIQRSWRVPEWPFYHFFVLR